MVQLATNQTLRSREPQIKVENPLKPGRYRFSLVVVDTAANESKPAEITVTVVARRRPVRPDVVRDIDTIRHPIAVTPRRVPR